MSIVAFNVGTLLAEIPKLVQERDAVYKTLVDGRDLVLSHEGEDKGVKGERERRG